jgi:hypothetical protein
VQRLTLADFRHRLVGALLTDDATCPLPPSATRDVEGLQLHIGVRYLLLAPLYGYSLRSSSSPASKSSSSSMLHDGVEETYELGEFRARVRGQIREELERAATGSRNRAIDLTKVAEAEVAAAEGGPRQGAPACSAPGRPRSPSSSGRPRARCSRRTRAPSSRRASASSARPASSSASSTRGKRCCVSASSTPRTDPRGERPLPPPRPRPGRDRSLGGGHRTLPSGPEPGRAPQDVVAAPGEGLPSPGSLPRRALVCSGGANGGGGRGRSQPHGTDHRGEARLVADGLALARPRDPVPLKVAPRPDPRPDPGPRRPDPRPDPARPPARPAPN